MKEATIASVLPFSRAEPFMTSTRFLNGSIYLIHLGMTTAAMSVIFHHYILYVFFYICVYRMTYNIVANSPLVSRGKAACNLYPAKRFLAAELAGCWVVSLP
jgi:hypothetical protein